MANEKMSVTLPNGKSVVWEIHAEQVDHIMELVKQLPDHPGIEIEFKGETA